MFSPHARSYLFGKPRKRLIYPALAFVAVWGLNFYRDRAFFVEIAKVLRQISKESIFLNNAAATASAPVTHNLEIISMWYAYGVLGFFVLGIVCIVGLFIRGRFFRLIPFFMAFPVFFYLIDAHISSDHPWMLRRYMFAILPITTFYATLLIAHIFNHKGRSEKMRVANISIPVILTLLLLAANLKAIAPVATYSENSHALSQIGAMSSNFSGNDLVLVDRLATGDAWSMMSGPLRFIFGKNAAYFFNPEDLAKIDFQQYDKIYLVIPNTSFKSYAVIANHLREFSPYSISTSRLSIQNVDDYKKFQKAQKENVTTNGKIYVYEPGQ